MTVWALHDLPSRITEDPNRAAQRSDPYWDGMFSSGTSDGWVNAAQYRRFEERTRHWSGVPRKFVTAKKEAMRELASNRHRASILSALGAVHSWRTVTREQLAAISGSPTMCQTYPSSLSAPFSAGLLAHGYVSAGMNRLAPRDQRMSMWSVGDDRVAFTEYAQRGLTFAERMSVTGGEQWSPEHRFDRHNVLTTELALRVAEYCDVATVLGEKHVSVPALLESTGERPGPSDVQRKADMGIVRRDGLTILVETTGSAGLTFRKKMHNWAQALQRHPVYDMPVVVLVLDASTPAQQQAATPERSARNEILDAVRTAVADFPGSATNRTAARIGVASWSDWFPERHGADDSFLDLTARFPIGDDPQNRWESVRILDDHDLPFKSGSEERGRVIERNARILAGTPYWLRMGSRPELWRSQMRAAGVDSIPGVPEPLVPERMLGAGFTQAVGGRRWVSLAR